MKVLDTLQIVFIFLKLTNVIDWPWWLVLCIWGSRALFLVVVIMGSMFNDYNLKRYTKPDEPITK